MVLVTELGHAMNMIKNQVLSMNAVKTMTLIHREYSIDYLYYVISIDNL